MNRHQNGLFLYLDLAIVVFLFQVSEELIRVAILWHELWHEGLEEASRLYFGERNVKGMFSVLEPLHQMMERGPQTLNETSFQQVCSVILSYSSMPCECIDCERLRIEVWNVR